MSDFDDILSSQSEKQGFDKAAWKEKKQAERQEVFELVDSTTEAVLNDGSKFRGYLDVQSKFENYSVSNAMLIYAQMPEATQLKNYSGWKKDGLSVQKDAKGILIMEPGKPYKKSDGTRGTYYNVKKVFDVSQIDGEIKKEPTVKLDDRVLIKALIAKSPVPIQNVDELPNNMGALYDHEQKQIFVRRGMSGEDIFRSVSNELAHAEIAGTKENYNRKDVSFSAYCTSYMLCKKYGVDVSNFRFNALPAELRNSKPKDARASLETIKKTANQISGRMTRSMDRQRNPKSKEQER